MVRLRLLLFTLIFFSKAALAQPAETQSLLPQILPSSPEAASFSKYGTFPVNLYSGLPDISIPLYTIKAGELELPVSISYHASGIKVTDWGSWVGLGWNLNAGGMITRKIMGIPDDQSTGYLSGQTVRLASSLDLTNQTDLDYVRSVSRGTGDYEPDIFSYSFPGKNGKFLYNQANNFTPIILPYDPIVINRVSDLFDITDERGVNFQFHDEEYSTYSAAGNTTSGASAWVLTKMLASNKQDAITLSYAQRFGQVSQDFTDLTIVNDLPTNYASSAPIDLGSNFNFNSFVSTDERKIQEIDFPNGKVIFDPSVADRSDAFTGQKSLSDIKVYNFDPATQSYKLLKQINFYQSYFTSTPDNAIRSLRLDSIGITDNSGITIEKYKFNYNAQQLPRKDSRTRDYWGYNNGKQNNILVPPMTIPYQSDPAHNSTINIGSSVANGRDPDSTYMQAAMLTRIYYPTGGYTDFSFQTNRYLDNQNNMFYAGGLRIKSISNYDGVNPTPIIKTYVYGAGESGTGRANFFLNNYFYQTSQTNQYISHSLQSGVTVPTLQWTRRQRTFLSNPSIDVEPYDGSIVTYSTVTEYIGDGTNNVGKTIYYFTDPPDGSSQSFATNHPVIRTYHMNRGLISKKEVYINKGGGTYQIASSENNLYEAFPETIYPNVGIVCFKTLTTDSDQGGGDVALCPTGPGCPYPDSHSYIYANYDARSDDNRLIQTAKTDYDQNDITKSITTTVVYNYNNFKHQQVNATRQINSLGDSIIRYVTYPADYLNGTSTSNAVLDTMLYYNMQNSVVEKWDQVKTNSGPAIIGTKTGLLNFYRQIGVGQIKLDLQKELETAIPLTSFTKSSITGGSLTGDARYTTSITYSNYDPHTNITQYIAKDGLINSFDWGYNKMYPTVKIQNASNTANTVASPLTTTGTLNLPTNNFGQQITTFTSNYVGTITVKIPTGSYLASGGTITVMGQFTLTGPSNQSGTMCISSGSGCTYPSSYTYTNMPAGNYTFTFSATTNNATSVVPIQFIYQGIQYTPVGIKEFFYEGFEENTASQVVAGNAYSGSRYYNANYTVPFTLPNARNYILQYWNFNGTWHFNQQAYTGSTTITGPVDEVRVLPADAQMTTYAFQPLIGVTEISDLNAKKTGYEYDSYQRLKNIRDYQGNIIKNYQYNYKINGCGTNCFVLPMQTFAGTNTLSYPVGVFNVNGKLVGNVTNQTQYVTTWMSDTANSHTGTLVAGADSMHFKFTVNAGRIVPNGLTGCRYYQYDFYPPEIYGITNANGSYIDFGDGYSARLGNFPTDTTSPKVYPNNNSNLTNSYIKDSRNYDITPSVLYNSQLLFIHHLYPNSNTKTITVYHNDDNSDPMFWGGEGGYGAIQLTNLRGYFPQQMTFFDPIWYYQGSTQTVANVYNWNSINSILFFEDGAGPSLYTPDFMKNNLAIQEIYMEDTMKIKRLKSDWNVAFTKLQTLIFVSNRDWDQENLSALKNLRSLTIQNGYFGVPFTTSEIDSILIQIAAGAGQNISNGTITLSPGAINRSSASDAALAFLKTKGWVLSINNVVQ